MAAAKKAVAGTRYYIGTTASNGASDSYTEITGAKQVGGDVGGTYQVVDTTDISDLVKQETKTLLDPGQADLEMHEIVDDAGQAAIKAAFEDTGDVPYNFKVVYPTGDSRRYKAKVMSYQPMVGGANAIRMIRSRVSLTEAATYVAA